MEDYGEFKMYMFGKGNGCVLRIDHIFYKLKLCKIAVFNNT